MRNNISRQIMQDHALIVYFSIRMCCFLLALLSGIFAADLPIDGHGALKSGQKRARSAGRDDICDLPIPIPFERTISAEDFVKWLNARLKCEDLLALRSLSKAECIKPDCIITVHYHGGGGVVQSQGVYDPDHIFMQGETFTPNDHNHLAAHGIKGTRRVGFYSLDGERVLCMKANPEIPGLERAARLLYVSLFGIDNAGVPNSLTILMNGRVFTVSSYVAGESFDEIIKLTESTESIVKKEIEMPKEPSVFIRNLHEMQVFAILTEPEDGRPQNYIWQVIGRIDGHRVFHVFSIDNERILGNSAPHTSRVDGATVIRGHSIIHCIPEDRPDYRCLVEKFSATTPTTMCVSWLQEVRAERLYHRNLIPYTRTLGDTYLGLPLTKEKIKCLHIKLNRIYEGLRAGMTLESIFMQVNPQLAAVYRTVSTGTPITPPGVLSSCESTPPRSCLRRTVKRVRKVDGGRAGEKTPASACGQLFGDYLPSQQHEVHSLEVVFSPFISPPVITALTLPSADATMH